MSFFYRFVRTALFKLDAELAHNISLATLQRYNRGFIGARVKRRVPDAKDAVELMGIRFPNRVGLSAGLDKNGDYIDGLGNLGFGFLEIGTVTLRPQPGNDRPRVFRLPSQQAIINRMGFNNNGVAKLVANVRAAQFDGVLGINIGKNASTPLASAIEDYLGCLHAVYSYASYVAVNVSSPNTPGLRDLQHGESLERLFAALKNAQKSLSQTHGHYTPIVIKIAPDLDLPAIENIAAAVMDYNIDGIIATNTTQSRDCVAGLEHGQELGGLSGAPLTARATQIVRQLAKATADNIPIIAAGGIVTAQDAQAKIDAGAQLVQLYSGLIYRGPALIGECAAALR